MTATRDARIADDADRPEALAPVAASERIGTLDFIRGIAVMGILAANIVAFGQPFEAYMYPGAFRVDPGDPGGWQWLAQFVLIDGKLRGLFTLLFGAGMVLFMNKAGARGATGALLAWRLVILMAVGFAHYILLFPGDILYSYGLFGLSALAAVRWDAKRLLGIGLTGYLVGVVYYALAMSLPWLIVETDFGLSTPDLAEQRATMIAGVEARMAGLDAAYAPLATGDYAALVAHRLEAEWWKPLYNASIFAFETLPLMLIGMALYRIGFFSGGIARAALLRWGWIGVIAGGLAHLAIGLIVRAGGFTYFGTLAAFVAWSPLPRLWMVLGLAALLTAWAPAATGWLGIRVRAAGRAAFSNYLGTSVVMAVVFQGWGLGLFGQFDRPQLYVVTALACATMLAWSKPWLDRFNYGPLEWLWRCLTYRTVFPLRR